MYKFLTLSIALVFAIMQGTAVAQDEKGDGMAKVTGIGGVFILEKSADSNLAEWYEKHLGMKREDFGAVLLQWEEDKAEDNGLTVWGVGDHDSTWFKPSHSPFMINYRVDDLEKLLEQLTEGGVEIQAGPEYHENGIFAWIMDPDGNKIELWEPMLWDDKNKRE